MPSTMESRFQGTPHRHWAAWIVSQESLSTVANQFLVAYFVPSFKAIALHNPIQIQSPITNDINGRKGYIFLLLKLHKYLQLTGVKKVHGKLEMTRKLTND